jgi:hypothetical protein
MLLRRGALSAHAVGRLQRSGTILRTETSRYRSVFALTGVCQGGVNQQSGKFEVKDVKMHEVPVQEDGIWTPLPGLWLHDTCPN